MAVYRHSHPRPTAPTLLHHPALPSGTLGMLTTLPTESFSLPPIIRLDSTGLHRTMLPAKSNMGPAKLGGLTVRWTPVDSSPVGNPVDSTGLTVRRNPPDSTRLHRTPPDWGGLIPTGRHCLVTVGRIVN